MENYATEQPFDNFRDIEIGATLFKALQMSHLAMQDSREMAKINEIAEYVNTLPDPIWAIQRVAKGTAKLGDQKPIDHFLSYVRLEKEKGALAEKIKILDKELSLYG